MSTHPNEIIPAVLPHDFKALDEGIARAVGLGPMVQIDIVDGHYAKPKSWPYKDGAQFDRISAQEEGLPHWEQLDFEFDLMVNEPDKVVLDYVRAGAARIVVHAGAPGAGRALSALASLNEREGGANVVMAGVALGVDEHPDALLPLGDQFDYVQVMGIEHEGRQGEEMDPRIMTLIERLRRRYERLPIQVDGGVRLKHVRPLVAAGATRLVCGSAIFGADDPKAAYEALYNEVNAH